jgi:hypothetical protein
MTSSHQPAVGSNRLRATPNNTAHTSHAICTPRRVTPGYCHSICARRSEMCVFPSSRQWPFLNLCRRLGRGLSDW